MIAQATNRNIGPRSIVYGACNPVSYALQGETESCRELTAVRYAVSVCARTLLMLDKMADCTTTFSIGESILESLNARVSTEGEEEFTEDD